MVAVESLAFLKNGKDCLGSLVKDAILRASTRLMKKAKYQVVAVSFN